jgi:hypothetical protein
MAFDIYKKLGLVCLVQQLACSVPAHCLGKAATLVDHQPTLTALLPAQSTSTTLSISTLLEMNTTFSINLVHWLASTEIQALIPWTTSLLFSLVDHQGWAALFPSAQYCCHQSSRLCICTLRCSREQSSNRGPDSWALLQRIKPKEIERILSKEIERMYANHLLANKFDYAERIIAMTTGIMVKTTCRNKSLNEIQRLVQFVDKACIDELVPSACRYWFIVQTQPVETKPGSNLSTLP